MNALSEMSETSSPHPPFANHPAQPPFRAAAKRVVLAIPISRASVEKAVQGINHCVHQEMNWRLSRSLDRASPSLAWLQGWKGDGAFVTIGSREDAEIARNLPFPVVNLAAYHLDDRVTTLTSDHWLIGKMAAEHLLERRFKRLAYYGATNLYYSELRKAGFMTTVVERGAACSLLEQAYHVDDAEAWVRQERELETWLLSLEPPVAIMAGNDVRAGRLLEVCQRLGLRVPEQIAVIGVDNDPQVHAHVQPGLSSIARQDFEAGVLAARKLNDLMEGRVGSGELIFVPPGRIIARESTDVTAIEDPELASVIEQLRPRLGEGVGVEWLLEKTQWSRRRLEMRFQEYLGEAPYSFITRLRVQQASRLLDQEPALQLSKVAATCGFSDLRHFRQAFQRFSRQSPAQYRAPSKVSST